MKTLKEFLDKVTLMWPNLLNEEKELLCQDILKGNIFTINRTLKKLNKNIITRKKEGLNENTTN